MCKLPFLPAFAHVIFTKFKIVSGRQGEEHLYTEDKPHSKGPDVKLVADLKTSYAFAR